MEEKKDNKVHHDSEHHDHSHEHSEHHEHHESHEHHVDHSGVKKSPWMIISAILAIIVVVLLILMFTGVVGGKTIAGDVAGKKLTDFLNTNVVQGGGVTYLTFSDQGSLYEVNVSYKNQTIPVFITKDGKYFAQGAVQIEQSPSKNTPTNTNTNTNQPPASVPKTAKPKVQAFVFAYCPYGLQFEKALFPVYDLLKNQADINVVFIGAMHGEFEHVESLRQLAILNLYNKDKLVSYLKEFDTNSDIGSCSGDAACLNKYLPALYTKLGINKANVEAYMNTSAEKLYQADEAAASQLGVSGSPTFVINGVQANVDRTAESIKEAVCNAFTTAPAACNTNLSTSQTSPGFGASTASAAATTGTQCG